MLGVLTSSDCASDWERAYQQIDRPIWNRTRGIHPQCAGRERVLGMFGQVRPMVPATTFTPSSRASDINACTGQSTSSQQSVLGYPLQSSHIEGLRWDQPQYCNEPMPVRSVTFLTNPAPRPPPGQIQTPTPRVSPLSDGNLLPSTVCTARTSGSDPPSSSREALGAIYAPSLQGSWRLSFTPGESTLLPDSWEPHPYLCGIQFRLRYRVRSIGYEARPCVALATPLTPVFY